MSTPCDKLTRQVKVVNDLGLHARSATMIAQAAQKAESAVWAVKDGRTADAASIIDLLTLACARGSVLTIKIENPADQAVLENIAVLFDNGFGE